MDKTRIIRRNNIILVVVTFFVLIGMSAAWFFLLMQPQTERIAAVQEEYGALQTKANGLQTAMLKEQQAKDRLEYLTGQMYLFRGSEDTRAVNGLYRRLYFGAIDGDAPQNQRDRQEAWRTWMNEYHYAYGPALRQELRAAAADPQGPVGLTLPDIKVDAPPQRPEDVQVPANGLLKPLSATNNGELELVVTGEFQNILRFLQRLNRSSFLIVVGNIKFEGYAPSLKATFRITPYLIAAGKGVKVTATSGAAAPAAAGGAPGGIPGDPAMDPAAEMPAEPPAPENEGTAVRIRNPRLSQQSAR